MTDISQDFWQWYGNFLKSIILTKWWKEAYAEHVGAVLVLVFGSIGLSVYLSPLWLFLTIPGGFTLEMHAWWRYNKKI